MSSFIKKWVGGFVLLASLVFITPWFMGWKMKKFEEMNSKTVTKKNFSILNGIDLTDQQRSDIKALEVKYQKEVEIACELHCDAKLRVANLLKTENPDPHKLFETEKEVAQAYGNAEEAAIRHVLEVSQVLNPQQKARYLQQYAEEIQASCPLQFLK